MLQRLVRILLSKINVPTLKSELQSFAIQIEDTVQYDLSFFQKLNLLLHLLGSFGLFVIVF